jgi:hypothetical protein
MPTQLLPLDADVPTGLVGLAAHGAERGELADEVVGEPLAHFLAEGGLLGAVAEVHRSVRTVPDGVGWAPKRRACERVRTASGKPASAHRNSGEPASAHQEQRRACERASEQRPERPS